MASLTGGSRGPGGNRAKFRFRRAKMRFAPPLSETNFTYVCKPGEPVSRRNWPVLAPPFVNGWIRQWGPHCQLFWIP